MTDDIFSKGDALSIIRQWLDAAEKTEPNDPNAIALATTGEDGLPNVRMVLLKGFDARGFTFYTNYASRKAEELAHVSGAAFVLHWKSLRKQIRVRGKVEKEQGQEADAYFASRSLGSRFGAWASRQSQPLEGGSEKLEQEVALVRARFGDSAPPRPEFWGGFRVVPYEIEFWREGKNRLHERARWVRENTGAPWEITRLYP